ncbi:YitT family protein [Aquimarina sp. 2201CG14-23]|uniref:YitT family protein n=1 Tax=Aquimarina mycalae TaxID=3040073 RepID=UPI0024780BBD|nr:YitT family protein [Aquimarina sp. 2201CG14-23]MDH7444353.1 YitT family protein [Aquimarina sp. 2201CG14-23]
MNPLLQYILLLRAKKKLKNKSDDQTILKRQIVAELRKGHVEFVHSVKEIIFISAGVLSAGFGLNGFLIPNQFIDGGATGVSLLLQVFSNISLGLLLIIVNLPFIILGAQTIGRVFAIKSIIAITALAIVVHFVPYPIITEDKLLIAFFGGFFLGLGIGMSMRGGGVIDGTEVLAIYLSRKWHMTVGDIILLINIVIFSVGAYLLSIEIALYAILTYLIAAKTVNYIVDGVEEYIGVTIISKKNEEIRLMLTNKMGKACTIYHGRPGYDKPNRQRTNIEIVYTVLTRLEIAKLSTEIDKIDRNAFIVMDQVKDIKGGMIKRKPMK